MRAIITTFPSPPLFPSRAQTNTKLGLDSAGTKADEQHTTFGGDVWRPSTGEAATAGRARSAGAASGTFYRLEGQNGLAKGSSDTWCTWGALRWWSSDLADKSLPLSPLCSLLPRARRRRGEAAAGVAGGRALRLLRRVEDRVGRVVAVALAAAVTAAWTAAL